MVGISLRMVPLAAIFALVLAACAAPLGPAPSPDEPAGSRLSVVATTTQVGAAAAEVGGERIDLTVLLDVGSDAHDYEMTPSDAAALEAAELILISGAGLEDWLHDALATVGGEDRVRDMSRGVNLRRPASDEPDHDHGGEREDAHDDDDHDDAGEDEAHEEDHGHAGEHDPHYWLTAANAARMVENVRDALSEAAPEQADEFRSRAAAYVERLQAADEEIRRLMAEIPEENRKIVTNHDAFGYFIDEYGLTFVGSIFPSLDVAAEPSARELAVLIEEIEHEGVVAIFSESAVNPALARAIADETDARVVDEPLYTDSLGPPGSGADTLDGMLLHNARVVHEALAPG